MFYINIYIYAQILVSLPVLSVQLYTPTLKGFLDSTR